MSKTTEKPDRLRSQAMAAVRLNRPVQTEAERKQTEKYEKALDAFERALRAAKALVSYIEFFRTHGTGDCMRKYPDDVALGGYDNIVRRAYELASACDGFDGRRRYRDNATLAALKLAYEEIHHPGAARHEGKDVDQIVSDAIRLASTREQVAA